MKPIWQSKTFWWNIISGVLAITSASEVTTILPPTALSYIAIVNAIGNVVLRLITTSPVSLTGEAK